MSHDREPMPILVKIALGISAFFLFILVLALCAKCATGQSYIGKPYYSVLRETNDLYGADISHYEESVECDGSRNIVIYFKNKQLTTFAFDAAKYCILYLVIMPDTSGHRAFAQHLDNKYERKSPNRWLEKRSNDTVVWKMLKSVDRKRTYIVVCPLYMEPPVNNILESYK